MMRWDNWRLIAVISISGFIGLLFEQMMAMMFFPYYSMQYGYNVAGINSIAGCETQKRSRHPEPKAWLMMFAVK